MSGVAQRLIKGHGADLRRHQNRDANLKSGELSKLAEDAVRPVAIQPGYSLDIEEAAKHGAVLLFFLDEEFEGWEEPRVEPEYGISGGAAAEAAAASVFAQLELL